MFGIIPLGVSSVIRGMSLNPGVYESMMHFFRESSWSLDGVMERWHEAVSKYAPVFCIFGRHILVGDGVKQTKEGHYMPGVKRASSFGPFPGTCRVFYAYEGQAVWEKQAYHSKKYIHKFLRHL